MEVLTKNCLANLQQVMQTMQMKHSIATGLQFTRNIEIEILLLETGSTPVNLIFNLKMGLNLPDYKLFSSSDELYEMKNHQYI